MPPPPLITPQFPLSLKPFIFFASSVIGTVYEWHVNQLHYLKFIPSVWFYKTLQFQEKNIFWSIYSLTAKLGNADFTALTIVVDFAMATVEQAIRQGWEEVEK